MGPRHLCRKSRLELLYACVICLLGLTLRLHFLGRRRVLSETYQDSQTRDTKSALKRGPVTLHAL